MLVNPGKFCSEEPCSREQCSRVPVSYLLPVSLEVAKVDRSMGHLDFCYETSSSKTVIPVGAQAVFGVSVSAASRDVVSMANGLIERDNSRVNNNRSWGL